MKGHRATPASIKATSTVTASLDLLAGTELWAIWGYIANRHAELAREGRAKLQAQYDAGDAYDANDELEPAMIAISAAAVSIDGFGNLLNRTGVTIAAHVFAQSDAG